MSVHLSANITAAPTKRLFVKWRLLRKSADIEYKYRSLYVKTYVYIIDSSAKCSVVPKQCEANPLLRFHGNTSFLFSRITCRSTTIHRKALLRFHINNGYAKTPQCYVTVYSLSHFEKGKKSINGHKSFILICDTTKVLKKKSTNCNTKHQFLFFSSTACVVL
jgi:hypothetical protein